MSSPHYGARAHTTCSSRRSAKPTPTATVTSSSMKSKSRGCPATSTVYDTFEGVVEDHKTKDGGGVYALRRYGPSRAYRWQLHLYGRGLELQGYEVKTVRIVAYAIDSSDDVAVWQEPYDRQIAQDALDHLARHTDLEDPPGPQKDAQDWCAKFCQYHDPSASSAALALRGKRKTHRSSTTSG
jgi:hypothetical protein